jgi:hypothetical protein
VGGDTSWAKMQGVQFVELQYFGKNVWNFSNERARVEANGTMIGHSVLIGSLVTKNFTDPDLAGEGAVGKKCQAFISQMVSIILIMITSKIIWRPIPQASAL